MEIVLERGIIKWESKSAAVGFPYVCNQAGRKENPVHLGFEKRT